MELKQYTIILVNLDPAIGSEIKKTRPCLIISPNEMNKYLQTIVVAPIISSSKPYPTRVAIQSQKTKGWVVLDQIRSIDKQRVVKTFISISEKEINQIKALIKETYVD